MSRPTKLTDEVQEAICEAIADGATYAAAAESAGLAYETFNEWMKDVRPRFVKFSEAVRQANARARVVLEKRVREASRKDWRAGAWILERRFPSDYGQRSAVDVTSGGERIIFEVVRETVSNPVANPAPEAGAIPEQSGETESDRSGTARGENNGSSDAGG